MLKKGYILSFAEEHRICVRDLKSQINAAVLLAKQMKKKTISVYVAEGRVVCKNDIA